MNDIKFRDYSPLGTRYRWGAEGGGITRWKIGDVDYVAVNHLRWAQVVGKNVPLPAGSFSAVYDLPTRRSAAYREMDAMRPHREPCGEKLPSEIADERAYEHRTGGWCEFWVPVEALASDWPEFIGYADAEPAWDD